MNNMHDLAEYLGKNIKVGASYKIPKSFIDRIRVKVEVDELAAELWVMFEASLASMEHRSVEVENGNTVVINTEMVPLSWWDHFKCDVFPKFLLDRFPPKYRVIETYLHKTIVNTIKEVNVCPYLDSGKDEYFKFLIRNRSVKSTKNLS